MKRGSGTPFHRGLLACCALRIRLGHSPDPDDAFMFWGLATGKVDPRGFDFEHVLEGIQTLNEWAHEGQLTYDQHGLQAVVDLGEWWLLETGLPLPLGINVARRDLGEETLQELSAVLRESIAAGLSSRREALEYALQFGRGLDEALADRFVGMYVNELTEDYGDEGREAVIELLRRGEQAGAFDAPVRVEFVA